MFSSISIHSIDAGALNLKLTRRVLLLNVPPLRTTFVEFLFRGSFSPSYMIAGVWLWKATGIRDQLHSVDVQAYTVNAVLQRRFNITSFLLQILHSTFLSSDECPATVSAQTFEWNAIDL